jgi:hypothetical protein
MNSESILFCIDLAMKWCDLRERNKITRVCKEIVKYMDYLELWESIRAIDMIDVTRSQGCINELIKKYTKRIYLECELNGPWLSYIKDCKEAFMKIEYVVKKLIINYHESELYKDFKINTDVLIISLDNDKLSNTHANFIELPRGINVKEELHILGGILEYTGDKCHISLENVKAMPIKRIECDAVLYLDPLTKFTELEEITAYSLIGHEDDKISKKIKKITLENGGLIIEDLRSEFRLTWEGDWCTAMREP